MYSRFSSEREPPVQIPEQYSGWAFSRDRGPKSAPTTTSQKPSSAFLDVAKPSYSPHPQEAAKERPLSEEQPSDQDHTVETQEVFKQERKPSLPSPLLPLFGNLGHAFPFSHGIGFEELLILGLLILLSRNNCDTETILLIGLLLFCG